MRDRGRHHGACRDLLCDLAVAGEHAARHRRRCIITSIIGTFFASRQRSIMGALYKGHDATGVRTRRLPASSADRFRSAGGREVYRHGAVRMQRRWSRYLPGVIITEYYPAQIIARSSRSRSSVTGTTNVIRAWRSRWNPPPVRRWSSLPAFCHQPGGPVRHCGDHHDVTLPWSSRSTPRSGDGQRRRHHEMAGLPKCAGHRRARRSRQPTKAVTKGYAIFRRSRCCSRLTMKT